MNTPSHRAVFDCVVYAQALISTRGPAAACIEHVRRRRVQLFASSAIIQEIRELPFKIPRGYDISIELAEQLANEIGRIAAIVDDAPSVYTHPFDPDDSMYIDLAVATQSKLIISRDRHLLNLMDSRRREGREFQALFPQLQIIPPHEFARQLREEEQDKQ